MKKNDKLNYMLRTVYANEECEIKRLREMCIIHGVAADKAEFEDLLQRLINKGCIIKNKERQSVLFRKPLKKDRFAAGMNYFGTREKIFYIEQWI